MAHTEDLFKKPAAVQHSGRIPPYNTGKVLIGSRYEPPRNDVMSRDACLLQSALLGDRPTLATRMERRLMRRPWVWMLGVVFFIFAISFVKGAQS